MEQQAFPREGAANRRSWRRFRSGPLPIVGLCLLALSLAGLTACGGGGGDTAAPPPEPQPQPEPLPQPEPQPDPRPGTISGELAVQALNRVDLDTNDPDAPAVRNNSSANAQPLDAPSIVGGHLAAPGSRDSRFGADGDPIDAFRVELTANQRVRLEFDATSSRDFDLFLADAAGRVIELSDSGDSPVEEIIVPQSGSFFIVAAAFSGSGNYRLTVGTGGVGATGDAQRSSDSDGDDRSATDAMGISQHGSGYRVDGGSVSLTDGGAASTFGQVIPGAFIVRPAIAEPLPAAMHADPSAVGSSAQSDGGVNDGGLKNPQRVSQAAAVVASQMLAMGFEAASASAREAAVLARSNVASDSGRPGSASAWRSADHANLSSFAVEQRWVLPADRRAQALSVLGLELTSIGERIGTDAGLWFDEFWQARQIAKRLMGLPAIAAVTPDVMLQTLATNDPLRQFQWAHDRMAVSEAWTVTRGGRSGRPVIVAVVDTGVFLAHEDLQGRLTPGFDFVSDVVRARDGDGIDPDPDDPGDSPRRGESSWHGTHVAGIVAANANNGRGVAGIAPEVLVMPLRALGAGGGSLFDVLQAIRFAAGLPNDSGQLPQQIADVVNLSLGGGVADPVSAALFRDLAARNVLVVAAAGNFARSPVEFPAAYDDVFAVGASDALGGRAPYSNFGSQLDLVAPGGDLRQTVNGAPGGVVSTLVDDRSGERRSDYAWYQGTSMAAPAFAAVLALGRSIKGDLSPAEVRALLASGAFTNSSRRSDELGFGELDALQGVTSVLALARGEPLPNRLSVSSTVIDFGSTEVVRTLIVRNPGAIGRANVSIEPAVPWLSVRPLSLDDLGRGEYELRVDRSQISAGDRVATQVLASQPGTEPAVVRVLAERANTTLRDSVGRAYVLLVDSHDEIVDQAVVSTFQQNRGRFEFSNVPPGRYRLVAGTDMNGDFFICDPFEACGAYPTGSLPESFTVDGDRSDLDFSVGFDVSGALNSSMVDVDAEPGRRSLARPRVGQEQPRRLDDAGDRSRALWPGIALE
ncbi:MAG: S8 family serine peptidase [Thioalkalivibrionaceae bacterium]